MLIYLPTGRRGLNVKALVGAFNQEKVLVGAFSVIVKTDCETDGAIHSTNFNVQRRVFCARERDGDGLCARSHHGLRGRLRLVQRHYQLHAKSDLHFLDDSHPHHLHPLQRAEKSAGPQPDVSHSQHLCVAGEEDNLYLEWLQETFSKTFIELSIGSNIRAN